MNDDKAIGIYFALKVRSNRRTRRFIDEDPIAQAELRAGA